MRLSVLLVRFIVAGFGLVASHGLVAQQAFIDRYCVGCHSEKSKSGNLVLTAIPAGTPATHPDEWERVVRRLRTRSMPPVGVPRPAEAEYLSALSYFETALDRAATGKPNPGRTDTFRRLNRTEYHNAIRDLLAVDIDTSTLLPADDASHGFDNVTVGELSPLLLERYLNAARKISRLAVGSPVKAPVGETILLPPDLTQEGHVEGLPLGTRGGTAVSHLFPVNGDYEFQLRLARDRNEKVEGLTGIHQLDLLVDGQSVRQFTIKQPPAGEDHSKVDAGLIVRIPLQAGTHQIAATFLKKPTALLETERQPYIAHFNMDRHPRIQPALYSLAIVGPFQPKGPGETESRRQIFSCHAGDPCAQSLLLSLARRAWRGPVTAAEIEVPMRFFREGAVNSFDEGMELALRAVLISPRFLFRMERDPAGVAAGSAYRISDVELASRLSFFLWSSIPDPELLDLATAGKLRQPGVLEHQVKRMLEDRRADSLVSNFAEQWLYLRNLASVTPDARIFPDFDDNLRQALRIETEMFFESVMREDRSVLDLLRANYTFVNERLARHYGIPNVYGSRFRRVTFDSASERGGLLGQGSILTVTSYATRTAPTLRGKWILTNILGTPPPSPPPGVPPLKENAAGGTIQTMRERMAAHRENPACAGCHKLMDPAGFALENFDAVGRWRTRDAGVPVDSAGGLPDGASFTGVAGLRTALLARPDVFAGNMVEKLLTFAVGRGVGDFDGPAVRGIVKTSASQDYRFSSLVLGIVNSTPFQMRRAQ